MPHLVPISTNVDGRKRKPVGPFPEEGGQPFTWPQRRRLEQMGWQLPPNFDIVEEGSPYERDYPELRGPGFFRQVGGLALGVGRALSSRPPREILGQITLALARGWCSPSLILS